MLNKLLLFTLLLLTIGSQAQQPLESIRSERIAELLARVRQISQKIAPTDSKTNVLNFAKGFLQGIESAQVFDEIKSCIADDEAVMSDIQNGIRLIETKTPENVKRGVQILGQAAQIIPAAATICRVADAKVQKLLTLIESFTNPESFLYYVGKSLLINHVEVIHEVESAIKTYQSKNFTGTGFWVGSAMATIFIGDHRHLSQDFVDYLNEKSGWQATSYEKFKGMTIQEIKTRYLGAEMIDPSMFPEIPVVDSKGSVGDIPASFNSSEQWPGCVHPIRDQGKCGSCWAFGASESLSDRFCIASNGSVQVVLSPQYLVSCNNIADHGCHGGNPVFSWYFMQGKGLVTDGCLPYQSGKGHNPVKCKNFKQCEDGTPMKNYYAKKGTLTILSSPAAIQANLMQYGPVEAAMLVFEDFIHYKGGIYKHVSGAPLGGHAIKIIGWGVEDSTNYWIVANSWNTTWGENGFFRIAWGQCGIDKAVVVGQADLDRLGQSELLSYF